MLGKYPDQMVNPQINSIAVSTNHRHIWCGLWTAFKITKSQEHVPSNMFSNQLVKVSSAYKHYVHRKWRNSCARNTEFLICVQENFFLHCYYKLLLEKRTKEHKSYRCEIPCPLLQQNQLNACVVNPYGMWFNRLV